MSKAKYILDANIFIQAYRQYYAFDLCPGFWESIVHHGSSGAVVSIDRVKDELLEGKDLAEWKAGSAASIFIPSDTDNVIESYRQAIAWVQNQNRFRDAAKSDFAAVADGWVIACAMANKLVVVTHERSRPESKTKVMIPDVCEAFDVQCTNTFQMLRNLEVKYHWPAPA